MDKRQRKTVIPKGRETNGVNLTSTPAHRIFLGNPNRIQWSLSVEEISVLGGQHN